MSFRRSVAAGAFAAVVAMSGALPAGAQGFGGGPPPYTPEPGAKDLKAVLYNWTWHTGMLRGQAEPELVGTLDYHAEGTVQVDGQPCALTKFRTQANYQTPGLRTQIECKRSNGQTYSNVETLSGQYAWDEDIPGAELVAGEGKATPRKAALEERMIRLWASPHGAAKAAIAAAAGVPLVAVVRREPGRSARQTGRGRSERVDDAGMGREIRRSSRFRSRESLEPRRRPRSTRRSCRNASW